MNLVKVVAVTVVVMMLLLLLLFIGIGVFKAIPMNNSKRINSNNNSIITRTVTRMGDQRPFIEFEFCGSHKSIPFTIKLLFN